MKNLSHFRDEYRERAGKPPMVKRNSPAQTLLFARQKLITFFRDKSWEIHRTTYFSHPVDMKDAIAANSAIGRLLKKFFERCDNDVEKGKEVITWFLESDDFRASENSYSPMVCFTTRTVMDFENKGFKKKETNEERAKRLLIAARKRGGPDDDESDYRMWARNDFQKELGIRDQAFTDSDLYKSVKHIIGL